MKTNKQKKIQTPESGFKRSKFNWSHDVNTTFSWGEIQPTQVKLIQPDSKTTMSTQELIRLAPMVAPTFGRIKFKTFNQFVPIAELFKNYDRMMAQEPVSTSFGTRVPQALPSINLGRLSSYVLHGARATVYYVNGATSADRLAGYSNGLYRCLYRSSTSATPTNIVYSVLFNSGVLQVQSNCYVNLGTSLNTGYRVSLVPALMRAGDGMKQCYINDVNPSASLDNSNKPSIIPLANPDFNSLFPLARSVAFDADGKLVVDPVYSEVTFDGADYIIEFSVNDTSTTGANGVYYFALAVELSDFGKRIRKVLQGCGYQIDFTANYDVSLLPLLAQYKAYFDVFGLQLYQGWETTYCAKFLDSIDQCFIDTISNQNATSSYTPLIQDLPNLYNDYVFVNGNSFINFMLDEVGNEWYTEDPDWIGSHVDKLAVSPKPDIGTSLSDSKFISVDSTGITGPHLDSVSVSLSDDTNYSQEQYSNYDIAVGPNQNAVLGFIDNIQHSQVDSDLLKRLYRWTNRNTILGRTIEKLLRAQGLGAYVDETKTYFIGSTDNIITISDVVSEAATSDAVLGEYGGRGLQYLQNGTLVYENKCSGYWVTLACIVPVSGYTQGLDPTLTSLKKFDLYNPDFDAMGYMITPKNVVCGSRFISPLGIDGKEGLSGFGFTPMYSNFKVCQNLTNGDFNRHNLRNKYLPYTLDKQLSFNDYDVLGERYDTSYLVNDVSIARTNHLDKLAVAGNVWRTPTKYPWLGNFERIFYNMGDSGRVNAQLNTLEGYLIGWDSYNSDNFLSHAIYDVQCYAPMKPIEESYGLGEDTNPTNSVSYTSKA